ncbi:unnamed protein product [Sphagnum troendelagicum]|uniref:Uncharacterized protein n=1 Tax=Sphagnum troendelagicum TaxID=128251 RepID=A0ABP0TA97_9BRYO
MRAEYKTVMDEVLGVIRQQRLICFTLDGATDVQGKQVINMMACGPIAFFLEHFTMELRRESASNLLEKLLSAKLRLLNCIQDPAPGFILASGEGNVEIVEEGQVCSRTEHFLSPPMLCFCSDSSRVMVKLRKDYLLNNEFTFAYGCAPHSIHNFCMDLLKNFSGIKTVLKQIIYMVQTLKSSHLLIQLFDKLYIEKYQNTYVLILFTKTRWGTVFYTAQRANKVKAAITALPSEILYSELDIDCRKS